MKQSDLYSADIITKDRIIRSSGEFDSLFQLYLHQVQISTAAAALPGQQRITADPTLVASSRAEPQGIGGCSGEVGRLRRG